MRSFLQHSDDTGFAQLCLWDAREEASPRIYNREDIHVQIKLSHVVACSKPVLLPAPVLRCRRILRPIGRSGFTNEPTGVTVTLGFNVPQTGPYAEEGLDELRAQELAVEHLNGEGDGGMLNTFSSKALKGNGILGKKVKFVTGDTQTKSDAARASAKSMIEKDGAVMINGGSSSGVAVAVQGLCQEAGVIFMAGLTHSNDTTGKDKKANGFRHFFNALHVCCRTGTRAEERLWRRPSRLSPDS